MDGFDPSVDYAPPNGLIWDIHPKYRVYKTEDLSARSTAEDVN